MACEEFTIYDHTSAHAGSNEETNYVFISLCCAVAMLAEHTYIYIISDEERNTDFVSDLSCQDTTQVRSMLSGNACLQICKQIIGYCIGTAGDALLHTATTYTNIQ